MAHDTRLSTSKIRESLMPHSDELRKRAAWYRKFAEQAGNPWIWEARLRKAEELEVEVARFESRPARKQEPFHRSSPLFVLGD